MHACISLTYNHFMLDDVFIITIVTYNRFFRKTLKDDVLPFIVCKIVVPIYPSHAHGFVCFSTYNGNVSSSSSYMHACINILVCILSVSAQKKLHKYIPIWTYIDIKLSTPIYRCL